jgi:hypothetical protein
VAIVAGGALNRPRIFRERSLPMADHDNNNAEPQRQAVPHMLRYTALIAVLAILIMLWFAFRR